MACEKEFTKAFVAKYTACYGPGMNPAVEPTFRIFPPPRSTMSFANLWVSVTKAVMFKSIIFVSSIAIDMRPVTAKACFVHPDINCQTGCLYRVIQLFRATWSSKIQRKDMRRDFVLLFQLGLQRLEPIFPPCRQNDVTAL